MQRFYRPSPRDLLRDVPLALLIGSAIGIVLRIDERVAAPLADDWTALLLERTG